MQLHNASTLPLPACIVCLFFRVLFPCLMSPSPLLCFPHRGPAKRGVPPVALNPIMHSIQSLMFGSLTDRRVLATPAHSIHHASQQHQAHSGPPPPPTMSTSHNPPGPASYSYDGSRRRSLGGASPPRLYGGKLLSQDCISELMGPWMLNCSQHHRTILHHHHHLLLPRLHVLICLRRRLRNNNRIIILRKPRVHVPPFPLLQARGSSQG